MRLSKNFICGFIPAVLIGFLVFITSTTLLFNTSCYPGAVLKLRHIYNSSGLGGFLVRDSTPTTRPGNDVNYRTRFKGLWHQLNPTVGLDMLLDVRKYMIYRCGIGMLGCGGWADRVKGMILGYMFANLTGRVFKIDVHDPECDITQALVPNRVDWRLPRPFHSVVRPETPPPGSTVLDYVRHPMEIWAFEKVNISRLFNQNLQYVYMKANLDHMDRVKKTWVYPEQLAWMKDLRKDQIYAEFYKRLFRLSPVYQSRLERFLDENLPTPEHKLICAHIRMGRNPTIPQSYEQVRMLPEYLPTVWNFISNHSRSDLHKVFIISDSEDTVVEAKKQRFAPRMISSPGEILHIEYAKVNGSEARCQALKKVIFDQAVLMNCDTLLISKSGLSRMAAFVRGSDEGLYCLFPWGNITECKSDQFTRLYHISG